MCPVKAYIELTFIGNIKFFWLKTEGQKGKDIVSKKCALSFVNKHTCAYWLLLLLLLLLFSFYAGVAWESADMNGYLFSFYGGALARSGAPWVKIKHLVIYASTKFWLWQNHPYALCPFMLADVKCQNSVSTDQCHMTAGSSVQLIEVTCFVKFSADQLWYLRDRRRRKQPKKYYCEKSFNESFAFDLG